jgi:hypothetical protein
MLRKTEDPVNGKRKHWIILCGILTLEEAMDLSIRQTTGWNEYLTLMFNM